MYLIDREGVLITVGATVLALFPLAVEGGPSSGLQFRQLVCRSH